VLKRSPQKYLKNRREKRKKRKERERERERKRERERLNGFTYLILHPFRWSGTYFVSSQYYY
jgi:hypothetical protein